MGLGAQGDPARGRWGWRSAGTAGTHTVCTWGIRTPPELVRCSPSLSSLERPLSPGSAEHSHSCRARGSSPAPPPGPPWTGDPGPQTPGAPAWPADPTPSETLGGALFAAAAISRPPSGRRSSPERVRGHLAMHSSGGAAAHLLRPGQEAPGCRGRGRCAAVQGGGLGGAVRLG